MSRKIDKLIGDLQGLTVEELEQFDAVARDLVNGTPDEQVPTLIAAAAAADVAHAPKGSRVRRMAAAQGRVSPSPEAGRQGGASLVAARSWPGVSVGEPITNRYDLARGIASMLEGAPVGEALVASAAWSYPEDRRLTSDQEANARKLDSVCHASALVASGGIASPVNVDYTVPGWATQARPLRDGLPAFQADRGGISYVQPWTIATYAGATTIWTEATDANPAGATKPVVQVTPGTVETVYLAAVPTRLGFGNLTARFAPEQTAAAVDLAAAAAARIAENNLLSLIAAQCTADVQTSILLGATRDLLTALGQAAAGLRSAHRIPSTTMLTWIAPAWVKELIRVDLAREIGHAQNADWNSFAVTDDQVDELLATRGLRPVWHLDGQDSTVAGGVAQVFTAQTASGAIEQFPSKLVSYMFPEGAVQFLDGGRLDLGIVRDSVLDATNSFELFVETFEAVAFRGFAGAGVQLVSQLCANGTSAGTTSTTNDCA